ncbi:MULTISPECIES: nucleotide sugar dehydrogenase [unclassified Haladaptatus]|uniref:nucleotide sugar dehydrogenase n=1 Tax=unclassified Haladaptatus TaxID=2622732 RepID=UPI0023E80165|nr:MULTISPECIES: nucleotide sugar dehydrogenase [unclassified Haladaptatus]
MNGLYNSAESHADQHQALVTGQVPVSVFGLGKMGLPLAACYAAATSNVIGVDVNAAVVEAINRGECPIEREPGLDELVAELVADGKLRATTEAETAVAEARIHVVIVPTPITEEKDPNLSILEDAVSKIGRGLKPGDLVVIECTVPPGTSKNLVVPLLEAESGLDFGEFGVAFCPERTSSGRALEDIRGAYPKVVGGVDAESARVAELIYREINTNDVLVVSDATTAEAVKLFEGLYRDVNIALANELARHAGDLDVDVNEAIEVANSQPFCHLHSPGPGVGGHCIPYYPYFVMRRVSGDMPLLRTAREVNDSMPEFTAGKMRDELDAAGRDIADSTILVLGLTYRPAIKETRAAPAKPLIESLRRMGANVLAVDPILDDTSEFDAVRVHLDQPETYDVDGVILVTPHEEFDAIDWDRFADVVVIDGRGTLHGRAADHRVYTIGSK